MRKTGLFTVVAFFLSISVNGFASQSVRPTTTLAAETGNNTSTADSFRAQSNGNAGASNVSKVDTRSLMYPGSTTALYAHYMPWFGTSSHMDIGYDTADPNQSARQVNDMISRGIQGVIVDWYGRNFAHEDQSTIAMFNESQKHSGFKFAIMEDAGALKKGNQTSELIADLIYAQQKFMSASNYMKMNKRPVVFFFGVEDLSIDWKAVRNQVPGNPLFIFENSNSFGRNYADGAYSWIGPFGDRNDWGQGYLLDFYNLGQKSGKHTVGSVKKGFNDTMSGWSANRVINQNCGQTWLQTFNEIARHYTSKKQLESLQLVTWNDYEEGTAIEMGIENCVSVKGSASGSVVSWNISGNENTVHHYTIFISSDGQNLQPVVDLPAGTHSVDLAAFGFASGAYTVYVKAVGQPSIKNHMSGAIGYTSDGKSPSVPSNADLNLAATPTKISVDPGSSVSTSVTITPSGNFDVPVTLGCGSLPAGVTCTFDQPVVVPGTKKLTAKLTISANSGTTASLFSGHGSFAMWFPGLTFGMFVFGDRKRSRKFWGATALLAILALALVATGCGGGVSKSSNSSSSSFTSDGSATLPSQAGTYTFTINAQSGTFVRSTNATLTIN